MNEQLETALCEAATLTFEEMAFMTVEPLFEAREGELPLVASTSVSFQGPFAGRLEIWASRDLLQALAANMLGFEGVPPLSEQFDALGEITNIICGNMLPRMAGTTEIFYLGCPKVGSEGQQDGAAARLKLGLETGQVDLLIFLHDSKPREE
jgi:chemotaxis protein CheY-P-specific phosphatase CheC